LKLSESWGEVGHKTSAAIAQSYLKKNALDNVSRILKGYAAITGKPFATIVDIATYADEIRPQNTWSSAFHYVNMDPTVSKYDEESQCKSPSYCIVKALQNYTAVLKDRSITDPTRLGEALSFTIHLIGDLFQPLHVGNPSDSGGNGIKVTLSKDWQTTSKSTNLHAAWDTSFLQHWMNTEAIPNDLNYAALKFLTYVEADQILKNEYLNKIPNIITMTEDTRVVCINNVYAPLSQYNMSNVPIQYYTNTWPVVKRQVIKSGLQMAGMLNSIFDYNGSQREFINNSSVVFQSCFFTVFVCFILTNIFNKLF
jgi:hypothetical protein